MRAIQRASRVAGRRVVLLVAAAVVATVAVVWLLGAFRAAPPASVALDTTPTASAAAPATTAAAASSGAPGDSPAESSSTAGASAGSPAAAPPIVLVGAGDIARCDGKGDEATADLVVKIPGIVFTLGDNAYESGSPAEFRACYDPTWGRFRDRTALPVPGNHDYGVAEAAGYRAYFGTAATPDGTTWYSRDVGAWHVVVLDANCDQPDIGCGPDSAQVRWLRRDLAASDARCTLALWHQPRFSSGVHGNDEATGPFWDALYAAGADLVLNGHDHDYERFAPQNPAGQHDDARGLTEIVVGTGGGELRDFSTEVPNSVARSHGTFGVIEVTLGADGWSSRFRPTDGAFSDDARGTCH